MTYLRENEIIGKIKRVAIRLTLLINLPDTTSENDYAYIFYGFVMQDGPIGPKNVLTEKILMDL